MTKRKQEQDRKQRERLIHDIKCWRKWIREARLTALHIYSCGGPGWAPNLVGFQDTPLILEIVRKMVDRIEAQLEGEDS